MFAWLLALISTPAVQVGSFMLGVIPGAENMYGLFKKKKNPQELTYKDVKITCYGWLDNDPPSDQISSPVIHKTAGGVGTYDDPITCASDHRQIEKGTIIFVPRFRKYFIVEDLCGAAVAQPRSKPPIIDLWIGGTHASNKAKLTAKEEFYTLDDPETVILWPVNTLTVDVTPLYKD